MFPFLTIVRQHTAVPCLSYIVLKVDKINKIFYVVNVMQSVAACHGMACVSCTVLSETEAVSLNTELLMLCRVWQQVMVWRVY
jgi:hypothetical protein